MTELNFGKYAGRILEEIVYEDAKYARWLYTELMKKPTPRNAHLRERFADLIAHEHLYLDVIDFGKHDGQRVGTLLQTHYWYIRWILTQAWIEDRYPHMWNALILKCVSPNV